MNAVFVSETLTPLNDSFDADMMARGEPGLPHQFRWRKTEWQVAEVLESWKEHGDCANGSGERYVRKHVYRVRVTEGSVLRLHFQRSFGRGSFRIKSRWWVHSMEDPARAGEQGVSPKNVPFPLR